MQLQPGYSVAGGRFTVQRLLGSGAMAEVYLATDTSRQVPVALKMLRPDLALDSAFEEYFRREAQVMQALQHPNIVRMYEPLRDGEMLCLVLDYIDGPNLQKYLFGKKLLPIADALHIAQVLATALDYAHANGVIHRDLKPANVLLASNGTILLSDFGIARVASGTTTAAGMVGSPAYMSPEQIQSGAVTPASDQYSLGVLLWELTTGRRPFVGATPGLRGTTLGERVLEEHLSHQPPTGVLPSGLDTPLRKALSKQPKHRFAACTEMVQAVVQNSSTAPATQQQWARKIQLAPALPPPLPSPLPPPWWQVLLQSLSANIRRFSVALVISFILVVGVLFGFFSRALSNPEPVAAAAPTNTPLLAATTVPTQVQTGTKNLDGGTYIGELRNNEANGQGTWTSPDGDTYNGEFKDGKRNGQGTYTWPNGETYTGAFKNSLFHGQGTSTWPDGATYTGEWQDNMRNGQGTNTWPDGETYTGEYKDDKKHGQGTWTSPDGTTYTGEFKDDLFNGQGTWTSPDGTTYTGAFKDAKRNGRGTWTSPDGYTYNGEFKDNLFNGQGTYTWPDGETYTGEYKDAKRNGQGTYSFPDGTVLTGIWKDDELQK